MCLLAVMELSHEVSENIFSETFSLPSMESCETFWLPVLDKFEFQKSRH